MTMHLEGPWLSTTGKRKGKVKWASAEAKAKSEKAEAEWKALQKRWGIEAEDKKRKRALSAPTISKSVTPRTPPGRETARIASQDTGWVPCTTAPNQSYTGTKVKGIGTMHKSNAVPIFSDEEAVDISRMRR